MATTTTKVGHSTGIAHYGRMLICLLTFGFAYPNAFSENVDTAANDASGR